MSQLVKIVYILLLLIFTDSMFTKQYVKSDDKIPAKEILFKYGRSEHKYLFHNKIEKFFNITTNSYESDSELAEHLKNSINTDFVIVEWVGTKDGQRTYQISRDNISRNTTIDWNGENITDENIKPLLNIIETALYGDFSDDETKESNNLSPGATIDGIIIGFSVGVVITYSCFRMDI